MKKCSHCKKTLPKSKFGRHREKYDGLNTYCKKCATLLVKRNKIKNIKITKRKCLICGKFLTNFQKKTCSNKCSAIYSDRFKKKKHWRMVNGYKEIYSPESGRKNKFVREHLKVMSDYLRRLVKYPENVHHIDGDKLNNIIKNLCLCKNISEHTKIHKSMEELVFKLYKMGLVRFNTKTKRYELEDAVIKLWLKLNKK